MNSVTELDFFKPAIEVMQEFHNDFPVEPKNRYREDGITPYWTHPVAVANIVRGWGFEQVEPLAALFHDVLEDTIMSDLDIFDALAPHYMKSQLMVVLSIVEAVTKLDWACIMDTVAKDPNARKPNRALRKAIEDERFSRILDPRIAVIKIADRIHNLQTLNEFDPDFQVKYKAESVHTLGTLLGRLNHLRYMYSDTLGIYTMKPELYQTVIEACETQLRSLQS